MTTPADLLTIDQAAELLGVSAPTLRRIRAQIGFIRLGPRKIRFTRTDLDAYLAAARVAPAPTITQLHGAHRNPPPCPSRSQRKTRPTGIMTSSGMVVGFRDRQAQATTNSRAR